MIEDSNDFVDLDKMYDSGSESDDESNEIKDDGVISNNVFSKLGDSIALHKERLSRKKKPKKHALSKKVRFKKT
jgi:hypothetical protein